MNYETELTKDEARVVLAYLDAKASGRRVRESENDYILGRSADAKLRRIAAGRIKESSEDDKHWDPQL